jgi:monofunctional glycosyltransferase
MRKLHKLLLILIMSLIPLSFLYGAKGYFDARSDSGELSKRADGLIAANRGASGLGPGRAEQLLKLYDPDFPSHNGVDFSPPGFGLTSTTMTQSLAKRLAFETFKPGIRKIRQTGYAMGLESRLSKNQIWALFLETVELGRGRNGPMIGFHETSQQVYGRPAAALSEREYATILAAMLAPTRYQLMQPDVALEDRVDRIERLLRGECKPFSKRDKILDGCVQKVIDPIK